MAVFFCFFVWTNAMDGDRHLPIQGRARPRDVAGLGGSWVCHRVMWMDLTHNLDFRGLRAWTVQGGGWLMVGVMIDGPGA